MTSLIENISVDCADPYRLCQFWSQVLDLPLHPDNEEYDDEVGIPVSYTHLTLPTNREV